MSVVCSTAAFMSGDIGSFPRSDFMSIFREKSWFILFTSSYRDCQISFGDDPCSIIFSQSSVKVVLFFQWCLCPKSELLVLGTYDENPHIFIPFIGHYFTRNLSTPLLSLSSKSYNSMCIYVLSLFHWFNRRPYLLYSTNVSRHTEHRFRQPSDVTQRDICWTCVW